MIYLGNIVRQITVTSLLLLACGKAVPAPAANLTQDSLMEPYCTSPLPGVSPKLGRTADLTLYWNHSIERDPEFLSYVYSVAYKESAFDPTAISPKQAYGLLQVTRLAMMDAAAYCRIPVLRNMAKLLDPVTNIRYGTCYRLAEQIKME
jgi:soluble lytic murein transglycosylase-like protein